MAARPWDDVLRFWFGDHADDAVTAKRQERLWWSGRREDDAEIARRFGATRAAATAGQLTEWEHDGRGRLALVLLVDQFSRAMFRGSPEAFAHDALARRWVDEGLRAGAERGLRPIEQVFYALPLEHSEALADQDRGVQFLQRVIAAAPAALHDTLAGYLDFAQRHRAIIERFGRFPHRNAVLGRTSTPEEIAFLKQPGSSF